MSDCCYVGETRPNGENVARRHVMMLGYVAFFPQQRQVRVSRGQKVELLRPLFPSYVFIWFDVAEPGWRRICSVPGVKRLVGPADGYPEPLRDGVGDALQAMEPTAPVVESVAELLRGMRVRIKHGPLTGHLAKIARLKHERAKLLMSLFGRQIETDWLPTSWLEALSAED